MNTVLRAVGLVLVQVGLMTAFTAEEPALVPAGASAVPPGRLAGAGAPGSQRMPVMPRPLVEYEVVPLDPEKGMTDEVLAAIARNGFKGFTVAAVVLTGPRPCVVQQRMTGMRVDGAQPPGGVVVPSVLPAALQQELRSEFDHQHTPKQER